MGCLGLLFLIIAILLRYQYLLLARRGQRRKREKKERRGRGLGAGQQASTRKRNGGEEQAEQKESNEPTNDSLELVSASRFIYFDCSLFLLSHSFARLWVTGTVSVWGGVPVCPDVEASARMQFGREHVTTPIYDVFLLNFSLSIFSPNAIADQVERVKRRAHTPNQPRTSTDRRHQPQQSPKSRRASGRTASAPHWTCHVSKCTDSIQPPQQPRYLGIPPVETGASPQQPRQQPQSVSQQRQEEQQR